MQTYLHFSFIAVRLYIAEVKKQLSTSCKCDLILCILCLTEILTDIAFMYCKAWVFAKNKTRRKQTQECKIIDIIRYKVLSTFNFYSIWNIYILFMTFMAINYLLIPYLIMISKSIYYIYIHYFGIYRHFIYDSMIFSINL